MEIQGHPTRSREGKIILADVLVDLLTAGQLRVESPEGDIILIKQVRVDIDRPDLLVLEALDGVPARNSG